MNWSNILGPDMETDLVNWSWWDCDEQWQQSTAVWSPDYARKVLHSDLPTMVARYRILTSRLCSQGTAFWPPNYARKVPHSDLPTMLAKYHILTSRLCLQGTAFWPPNIDIHGDRESNSINSVVTHLVVVITHELTNTDLRNNTSWHLLRPPVE
jgi:hypothetical protein